MRKAGPEYIFFLTTEPFLSQDNLPDNRWGFQQPQEGWATSTSGFRQRLQHVQGNDAYYWEAHRTIHGEPPDTFSDWSTPTIVAKMAKHVTKDLKWALYAFMLSKCHEKMTEKCEKQSEAVVKEFEGLIPTLSDEKLENLRLFLNGGGEPETWLRNYRSRNGS